MADRVIWVNEQIDPCGIVYSCIACTNEQQAIACHESFAANLSSEQRAAGWVSQMRTVASWDEVPVAALKLSY
ncbi:MAG: glycogen debranching protein [Leptolyngbyaceae cyanobacterium]